MIQTWAELIGDEVIDWVTEAARYRDPAILLERAQQELDTIRLSGMMGLDADEHNSLGGQMSEVPFGLPSLDAGSHSADSGKACIMEYVSVLSGEQFSDAPACTHPVLAHLSRRVFDMLSTNDERYKMVPYIGRLFGTTPPEDVAERKALAVALAKHGVEFAQKSATDPNREQTTPDERLLALFASVLDKYDELTGRTSEQYYQLTNADLEKFKAVGLAVTGSI